MSIFSGDETPGEAIYDNSVTFRRSVIKYIGKIQKGLLPQFAIFQVLYLKWVYTWASPDGQY